MAKTKTTSKKTSTSNKKTTAPKTTQKKSASTRATAKTTPKTTKTTSKKQVPKKTTQKKKDNYMLIKSGLDREGKQQYTAVKVHDKTPRGWKEVKGATTAPVGYKWVTNGKSALFGKRKTALVKE